MKKFCIYVLAGFFCSSLAHTEGTTSSAASSTAWKNKTPHFSLVLIKEMDACMKSKNDKKLCLSQVTQKCETELTKEQCAQFIHYLEKRPKSATTKE